MKFVRTGIIINTEKYDECVVFYGDLFGPGLHCELNPEGRRRRLPERNLHFGINQQVTLG